MATTFLPINTTNRLGSHLRQATDVLREVRDRLEKLKTVMDTQVDGTDYTQLEAQFGLQAGHGVTVYNLVAGAYAAVDVAAVRTLIDRCG